jgi:alginate O-acetyltransferase complex protein AlgI
MVFTSPTFLFFFLPVTLLLNFLFQRFKIRNTILLLASLFFYIFGEGELVLLMLSSITVNYFLGIWIEKSKSKKALVIGVTINILILLFNKYANFIVDNLNPLFIAFDFAPIKDFYIKLPVGISFYTFQSISYLVDVYRRDNKAQKNFVDLALYVALFPQLIAGPIVRYKDIAAQLKVRALDFSQFSYGAKRFIIGLGKKVIIANTVAITADVIFDLDFTLINASTAWLGLIFYTIQIYFDFSGYSDMAIGLGYMLGFKFQENFNFPYVSKSIKEFWRRWHISLSMWFRDYLYISLGGNRNGKSRTYINLFIVFLLTGLWHGASWNFVIWGLIHGLFIVIERLGFDKILARLGVFQNLYTLFVVVIAWVFFRVEKFSDACSYISTLFIGTSSELHYDVSMFLSKENIIILFIALIYSFKGFQYLSTNVSQLIPSAPFLKTSLSILQSAGLLMIFVYSIMSVASGSYNPFIYFRF